jgi:hypothetical protein
MAVMPTSKLARAMARSDVDGKEAERKGSEVGGRRLFKVEVG